MWPCSRSSRSPRRAGFSFDNATGNGMFKKNVECGFNPSDVYDGYAKPETAWSSWLGRR